MPPHHLGRRRDVDDGDDFVRRRSGARLDAEEERHDERHATGRRVATTARYDPSQHGTGERNRQRDGQRHEYADGAFEREYDHHSRSNRHAGKRDDD